MVYVEWLRVRGTLKWTTIVLGILFVIACVARVTIPTHHHMERNHEMSFGYFIVFGGVVALFVATILGAPFARENDGHLEVALTKPVDRAALALMTIGVDAAGIVAALAVGTLFGIGLHTIFFPPWITFHLVDAIAIVFGVVAPLAWYAMLAAATSSLRRGYGAILGIAWPVAAIVAGLSLVDPNDNCIGRAYPRHVSGRSAASIPWCTCTSRPATCKWVRMRLGFRGLRCSRFLPQAMASRPSRNGGASRLKKK